MTQCRSMPTNFEQRLDVIERAMIEAEGAQFATRHLLSVLLARIPRREAQLQLAELAIQAQAYGKELGEVRLRGYLDELKSIQDALDHKSPRAAA